MSMTATPGTQTFTVCESVAVSSTTATDSQTVPTMKWKAQLSQRHTIRKKQELQQRCAQLEQDNARLRAEKQELKEKITVLNEDFKDNDEKVRFYIGLTNWNLLLIVIQFVQPQISENTIRIVWSLQIVLKYLLIDPQPSSLGRKCTYGGTIASTAGFVPSHLAKELKRSAFSVSDGVQTCGAFLELGGSTAVVPVMHTLFRFFPTKLISDNGAYGTVLIAEGMTQ